MGQLLENEYLITWSVAQDRLMSEKGGDKIRFKI